MLAVLKSTRRAPFSLPPSLQEVLILIYVPALVRFVAERTFLLLLQSRLVAKDYARAEAALRLSSDGLTMTLTCGRAPLSFMLAHDGQVRRRVLLRHHCGNNLCRTQPLPDAPEFQWRYVLMGQRREHRPFTASLPTAGGSDLPKRGWVSQGDSSWAVLRVPCPVGHPGAPAQRGWVVGVRILQAGGWAGAGRPTGRTGGAGLRGGCRCAPRLRGGRRCQSRSCSQPKLAISGASTSRAPSLPFPKRITALRPDCR